VNDHERHAVGIDLGGSQLRAACIDGDGRVLRLEKIRSAELDGPEAMIQAMQMLVDRVRDPFVHAIGVGIPGSIDRHHGVVVAMPAFRGWAAIPLGALLGAGTGLPVYLENDANAAALGEWRCGAGIGSDDIAYITISTGIGAGIISDGRLLRGVGGLAGEIGHTHVTDRSSPCSCGQIGCFEAVASGTALNRKVRERLPRLQSAEQLGEAARAGDIVAQNILDEEATLLGIGFTNLQHVYSPERIVMGGGVAALLPLMQARIENVMRERLLGGFRLAQLVPAALGDSAGLVGAASVALETSAITSPPRASAQPT
jgi:glucokinase